MTIAAALRAKSLCLLSATSRALLGVLLGCWLWPSLLNAQTASCQITQTGNPCMANSSTPSLNMAAGNPVNLATGNKFQQEDDLPLRPSGLEFIRYYNSMQGRDAHSPEPLGPKWRHSFSRHLYVTPAAPGPISSQTVYQAYILLDDGTRIAFEPFRASEEALAADRSQGRLLHSDGGTWQWITPAGHTSSFDRDGNLIATTESGLATITLQYRKQSELSAAPLSGRADKLVLTGIRSSSGEQISMHYQNLNGHLRLARMTTPAGNYYYEYDQAEDGLAPRLQKVSKPSGWIMAYGYQQDLKAQPAYLLSDIYYQSPDAEQPIHTNHWQYGWRGNQPIVVQSVFYNQVPSKTATLHFSYPHTPLAEGDVGHTIVTQDNGKQTHFWYVQRQGRYLLQQVSGEPCPACPPPGTLAGYNERGQLERLNDVYFGQDENGQINYLSLSLPGWSRPSGQESGWRQEPATELETGRLTLTYDEHGNPVTMRTPVTGTIYQTFDAAGRLTRRSNEVGHTRVYRYDERGNLNEMLIGPLGGPPEMVSHLQRLGPRRIKLSDTQETQEFYAEEDGRTFVQKVTRTWSDGQVDQLQDRYQADFAARTLTHELPEGGTLQYHYDKTGRLLKINWTNAHNKAHKVFTQSSPTKQTYGNGIRREVLKASQSGSVPGISETAYVYKLFRSSGEALGEEFRYLENDRVKLNIFSFNDPEEALSHSFTYALEKNALIVDRQLEKQPEKSITTTFLWHNNGFLKLLSNNMQDKPSQEIHTTADLNKAGLPESFGKMKLDYNSTGWLQRATLNSKVLGEYTYNSLGFRISKRKDDTETQFYYSDHQLLAESVWDHQNVRKLVTRRYIYNGMVPVAMIDYTADEAGRLLFIHSDSMGQPYLITDTKEEVQWMSLNSPFGIISPNLTKIGDFNIGLPGQYVDRETGFAQNIYRYYSLFLGNYLEPDPLGPSEFRSAYGYANHQPRSYVDPRGLLLFAFDGTTNTPADLTNPYKLSQLYDDGPAYYTPGPGTKFAVNLAEGQKSIDSETRSIMEWQTIDFRDAKLPSPEHLQFLTYPYMKVLHAASKSVMLDSAVANSTPYLLNRQWFNLIQEVIKAGKPSANHTLNIDITGFSRGAALSLIFGQRIASYTNNGLFSYQPDWLQGPAIQTCVNLRFMGLFDTVFQIGPLGAANVLFDYRVAPAWQTVAHAVALQEERFLFPLTTLQSYPNVTEQGFAGVHSDVGGTRFKDDADARNNPRWQKKTAQRKTVNYYGDYSKIPLNWIYDQGRLAGIKWKPLSEYEDDQLDTVQNPLLHVGIDLKDAMIRNVQARFINDPVIGKLSYYPKLMDPISGAQAQRELKPFLKYRSLNTLPEPDSIELAFSGTYPDIRYLWNESRSILEIDAERYVRYLEQRLNWRSSLKFTYNQVLRP